MARRSGILRSALAIFTIVNIGGAVWAVVNGEMTHAIVHGMLIVGTFVVWQGLSTRPQQVETASSPELDSHLDHLQKSVDAIALEVERIGEGQRFVTKIIQKDSESET